jgi:predicted aspartyl protease
MPTRWVIAAVTSMLLASCSAALDPVRPLGTVDYQRDGKLIMAQVKVNGRGPYWFLVDSGASRSVIDPTLAKELGLKFSSQTSISGTGTGKVAAAIAEPIQIALGGTEYRSEPYVIDLSGAPMSAEIRGLIGSELFASHVVRLDPARQRISWYAPNRSPPLARGAVLRLKSTEGKLYLPATIEPRPGIRIERDLRIDTGSESSVNDPSAADAPLVASSTLGNGLGSNFEGVSGKYHTIAIGPYRFKSIWGPGGDPPLIGMELLQRFVITFDAPHGRIHLSPLERLDRPVPHPPGTVRENTAPRTGG